MPTLWASSGSRAIRATRSSACPTSTGCSCSRTPAPARRSRSWTPRGSPRSAPRPPACSGSAPSPSGRSKAIGIIGCGRQAQAHLELAKEVFPGLARVTLFDRHPERAKALAAAHPDLDTRVASTAEDGGADAVITTAAIVRDPERPLRREHLAGATVACAIDFDASLAEDVFEDAALFVVDDVPQYRHYVEQGYFAGYPDDPRELRRRARPGGRASLRAARPRPARDRAGGRGGGRGDQPPRGGGGARHRAPALVDQPLRPCGCTATRQMREGEARPGRRSAARSVGLEAEGAAADQFDQLVQRVELGDDLDALGQAGRSGRRCRRRGRAA